METLDAIFTRRSVRSFLAEPVPDEVLITLVQAAVCAPSGGNAHPLIFLTISQPKRLAAVCALAPGIISPPPAVLLAGIDLRLVRAQGGQVTYDDSVLVDLGAALENMLLAAHALGFAACPVRSFHPAGLRILLGLPDHIEPYLLLALGKPRQVPTARVQRPIEQVYFKESYGPQEAHER